MSYELRAGDGLAVIGISTQASNASPEKIGDLWRRFHALGNQKTVEARLDEAVYCVYCEYEGDASQPYTVVIGCAVAPDAAVPEGLKKIDIAAGTFAVFAVTRELPMGVFAVWSEVWATPLDRRYQADFDRYGPDGAVTVHVGVR
jgi:predicted transcriptional regulator YdeE